MATSPLVDVDLERGYLLAQALEESGTPVDTAAWTFSEEEADWRLMVASPVVDTAGRTHLLSVIRHLLANRPDLDPGVGRIVALSPSDPGIQALNASSDQQRDDLLSFSGTNGVIRGRAFDSSIVYSTTARRYEIELTAALQRVLPPDAIMRRNVHVADPVREYDFVVDLGRRPVFIEAKASRGPLGVRDVQALFSKTAVGGAMVVVSRSGFHPDAHRLVSPSLELVKWRSSEDDPSLRASLLNTL